MIILLIYKFELKFTFMLKNAFLEAFLLTLLEEKNHLKVFTEKIYPSNTFTDL